MEPIPDQGGRRGSVAICLREDGRMLVIRRAQKVLAPLTYCFPGGGIEPGETESQALVREIAEELGVRVRPLRRLWQCRTPWNVRLSWWLAALTEGQHLAPDPREVESVHWMTPEEMLAQEGLLPSNREFLERLVRGEIRVGHSP